MLVEVFGEGDILMDLFVWLENPAGAVRVGVHWTALTQQAQ